MCSWVEGGSHPCSPGNTRKCSLDKGPEPRGRWDTKLGQGVPCGPSVLRAAWQFPTWEAHLKTESHKK